MVKLFNILSTNKDSIHLEGSHLFPQLDAGGNDNTEIQLLNFLFSFL